MNDQAIEQEIQAKGKTAPRITPADIEAAIDRAFYFTAAQGAEKAARDAGSYAAGEPHHGNALGLLTFCVLILRNGFTVTGESACASPENFDEEIGRKIARQNAVQKIWLLEGYLLKQMLHTGTVKTDRLTFGEATEALKAGKRIARMGWNGKGMFVYNVPAASYPVQTGAAKAHFGEGSMVPYNAYLALKGVDGTVSTWVPSVTDCLASDWQIVE